MCGGIFFKGDDNKEVRVNSFKNIKDFLNKIMIKSEIKKKKHVCNPNRPHLFIISCVQKCKFPSKDFHWQQSEESVWTSECMSLKRPTTISQLKNFIGNVQRWNRYWISNAETLICCLYIHKQAMVRKNSINKWKQHRKEWRKKIRISLKKFKIKLSTIMPSLYKKKSIINY